MIEKAKSLVKGCGKCLCCNDFCSYTNDSCGNKEYCESCKSKISTTLECWKEELDFLKDYDYNHRHYKSNTMKRVQSEFMERILELKEAIKILENGVGKK